jgi:hypothetical protein
MTLVLLITADSMQVHQYLRNVGSSYVDDEYDGDFKRNGQSCHFLRLK